MSEIVKALNQVMSAASSAKKTGHNVFHNYQYASESDILDVFRPLMVKAGLVLIPSVVKQDGPDEHGNVVVGVQYTIAHISGEVWPDKIMAMGCGNDKNRNGIGDKGLYKAITGANKYMLFKLFQISTGDDPENEVGEQATGTHGTVGVVPILSQVPMSTVLNPRIADAAGQTQERTRVNYDLVIAAAETFLDLCKTNDDLNNYYKENSGVLEGLLKTYEPEKYRLLLEKFKAKRKELSGGN